MSERDTEYQIIVDSLKGDLPSIPVVMNELMTVISDQDAALCPEGSFEDGSFHFRSVAQGRQQARIQADT